MNIHIEHAIKKFANNSQTELARLIGGNCRQGHIHQWLYELKKPSPFYCKRLQDITNNEFKGEYFHPGVFGPEPTAQ